MMVNRISLNVLFILKVHLLVGITILTYIPSNPFHFSLIMLFFKKILIKKSENLYGYYLDGQEREKRGFRARRDREQSEKQLQTATVVPNWSYFGRIHWNLVTFRSCKLVFLTSSCDKKTSLQLRSQENKFTTSECYSTSLNSSKIAPIWCHCSCLELFFVLFPVPEGSKTLFFAFLAVQKVSIQIFRNLKNVFFERLHK